MTRNYWLADKRRERDRRKGIRSLGELYEPYARSINIPFKVGEVLAIMVGERLTKHLSKGKVFRWNTSKSFLFFFFFVIKIFHAFYPILLSRNISNDFDVNGD